MKNLNRRRILSTQTFIVTSLFPVGENRQNIILNFNPFCKLGGIMIQCRSSMPELDKKKEEKKITFISESSEFFVGRKLQASIPPDVVGVTCISFSANIYICGFGCSKLYLLLELSRQYWKKYEYLVTVTWSIFTHAFLRALIFCSLNLLPCCFTKLSQDLYGLESWSRLKVRHNLQF